MSHTVMVDFTCQEGKGAEFLALLLPSLAETRAYEGCESCKTYVDEANPDRVVLWEKWVDKPSQAAYLGWRAETGMMDAIGPFMAAPPAFVHLTAKD